MGEDAVRDTIFIIIIIIIIVVLLLLLLGNTKIYCSDSSQKMPEPTSGKGRLQ